MRRLAAITCALWLLAALPAEAQPGDAGLRRELAASMRLAGPAAGAYVVAQRGERVLFDWRAGVRRILASNTKIFTTAAALDRLGPEGRFATRVLGSGSLAGGGAWRGDLYLRGGGDPTFGSGPFVRRAYGSGATVEALAAELEASGLTEVRGRVLGDEELFDDLRGGPDSGYRVSRDVGPLSALAFNRGLANERGTAFQVEPAAFAAARLDVALERRGIPRGARARPRAERALRAPSRASSGRGLDSPTARGSRAPIARRRATSPAHSAGCANAISSRRSTTPCR